MTGLPSLDITNFYDTLAIYRRFYPNQSNHKPKTLSEVFDTSYKPSHNAVGDILATGELLVIAVRDNIIPTSFQQMNAVNKHIRTF